MPKIGWSVVMTDNIPEITLHKNGYVVLSIDALFWGERGRKEGVSYDGQQALASNFMQMGASWGLLSTWMMCVVPSFWLHCQW